MKRPVRTAKESAAQREHGALQRTHRKQEPCNLVALPAEEGIAARSGNRTASGKRDARAQTASWTHGRTGTPGRAECSHTLR